jgi:Secretion system C-terminal sorting domain
MRKIITFLVLTLITVLGFGQVSIYDFASSSGTYTPITGGTVFGNATSDDERFVDPAIPLGSTSTFSGLGIPIGFNFTFNGNVYDRIAINYNGWISFGNSSLTPAVNIQSSSSYTALSGTSTATPTHLRNRVAGFNTDFAANAQSELRVQTIGTAPNRIAIVQWKNVTEYLVAGDINFQIQLHENGNLVRVVFGTIVGSVDNSDIAVGLGGSTNADFNNRTGSWATSTAGGSASSRLTFDDMSVPASGLTYTFTAASCVPPATVTINSVTIPTANISWAAVSGAVGYEYAITHSSTPPSSGTATTATTASGGSLVSGSAVFAHVRTNCGGSFSNWKTKAFLPCVTNISPADAATNVGIPPTFNWSVVPGATAYRLFFSTDNGVTYPAATGALVTPPATISGLAYSTTYKWYVRAIFGTDSSAVTCAPTNSTTFTTSAPPPPPANDECFGAVTLVPDVAVAGTNVSATQSNAPILCAGFTATAPVADVWYTVTSVTNGTFTVRATSPSPLDVIMDVTTGDCASSTSVTCADAGGPGVTEIATITGATPGQVYYIRLYGYLPANPGSFSITASGPALPVSFAELNAIRGVNGNKLHWKTLSENNNAGFQVERSADGRSFSSLSFIASKAQGGNSVLPLEYNFNDSKALIGSNYYRLKQTDIDGKVTYSNTVLVKGLKPTLFSLNTIFPNPATDRVTAALQSPFADNITLVVTDITGKIIKRQVANMAIGDNLVTVDVAALPSGSYLLKAVCNNGCETAVRKFTKQ